MSQSHLLHPLHLARTTRLQRCTSPFKPPIQPATRALSRHSSRSTTNIAASITTTTTSQQPRETIRKLAAARSLHPRPVPTASRTVQQPRETIRKLISARPPRPQQDPRTRPIHSLQPTPPVDRSIPKAPSQTQHSLRPSPPKPARSIDVRSHSHTEPPTSTERKSKLKRTLLRDTVQPQKSFPATQSLPPEGRNPRLTIKRACPPTHSTTTIKSRATGHTLIITRTQLPTSVGLAASGEIRPAPPCSDTLKAHRIETLRKKLEERRSAAAAAEAHLRVGSLRSAFQAWRTRFTKRKEATEQEEVSEAKFSRQSPVSPPRPKTAFVTACLSGNRSGPPVVRKHKPAPRPLRSAKSVKWADEVSGHSLTSVKEFERHPLEPLGRVGWFGRKPIAWHPGRVPKFRDLGGAWRIPFKTFQSESGIPLRKFRTEQAEHRYRAVCNYYERQERSWSICTQPNLVEVKQSVPYFYGRKLDNGRWVGTRLLLRQEQPRQPPFGECWMMSDGTWVFEGPKVYLEGFYPRYFHDFQVSRGGKWAHLHYREDE